MSDKLKAAVDLLNSPRLMRSGTGPRGLVLMNLPRGVTAESLQEAYDLVTAPGSPYAERPEDVSFYWVVAPEQRGRLYADGRQDRRAIPICEAALAWCQKNRMVTVPVDAFIDLVAEVEAADRNRQERIAELFDLMFCGEGGGHLPQLLNALEAVGLMKPGTASKLIEYGRANPMLIGNLFAFFSEGIAQSGQRIFDEQLDVRGIYLTFKPRSGDAFRSMFDFVAEMTAEVCDNPNCLVHRGLRDAFGSGGRRHSH